MALILNYLDVYGYYFKCQLDIETSLRLTIDHPFFSPINMTLPTGSVTTDRVRAWIGMTVIHDMTAQSNFNCFVLIMPIGLKHCRLPLVTPWIQLNAAAGWTVLTDCV